MIRTPQAKQQAEILTAELNRRGTKLPWSQALEIVARMQGFKCWNALSAAAQATPDPAAPNAVPAVPSVRYQVPGIEAVALNGQIGDARLADFLGHFGRDQSTTLLVWKAPDGQQYELRLCGQGPQDNPERDNSPYFEWLNDASDPVGGVFDSISANPQDEIDALQRMLG
jgi:hypothetical protein